MNFKDVERLIPKTFFLLLSFITILSPFNQRVEVGELLYWRDINLLHVPCHALQHYPRSP